MGEFGKSKKRVLELDFSNEPDAKRFSFKPKVIEHLPLGIKIQIIFDDPSKL
jgi:hypothetical protein